MCIRDSITDAFIRAFGHRRKARILRNRKKRLRLSARAKGSVDFALNGFVPHVVHEIHRLQVELCGRRRSHRCRRQLRWPQEAQPAESIPAETAEALTQALEDAQAAGEPVNALVEAVANGDKITTEIIGDEATGGCR